ncbi:PD40 domain-containing protein [Candidatus Micrarchaeota archaeon]|nr:PD40 domain-containing protein [Candidatus Micrarchaeota archaeon]
MKITPETDKIPPELHSDEFEAPVPMSGPINTAGAEDGPFMMPDGNTFYVFFSPDVTVPVEKQLLDGSTGIYVSHKVNGQWSEPERIVLNDDIALDGCEFVQGNRMWFCSARAGYTGVRWFSAEYKDGKWQNWQNADEELKTDEFETGELHISNDGSELYFHSNRTGGKGGLDIWVSKKVNGEWGEPVNVEAVNTERNDGWPALNPAEDELWITRDYGIWRSKSVNGSWTEPELIVSALAGEATIDNEGNVYFTHHFYENDTMLEADIYMIKKK